MSSAGSTSSSAMPSQEPIQLIGERLAVTLTERRWAARVHAGAAQLVHEVANGQTLPNSVLRMEFPPGIEGVTTLVDDCSGKGNVSRDHQVTRLHVLRYSVVGHIESGSYLEGRDKTRRWGSQAFVGDEDQRDTLPLSCTKQNRLDDLRARVGVNPDLHRLVFR